MRYKQIFNCEPYYKSLGIEPSRLSQNERVHMNRWITKVCFDPHMKTCPQVSLNESDMSVIHKFVNSKAKAKNKEFISRFNKSRMKRETNGAVCEYAALKFYGKEKSFDTSIVSDSRQREYPDFLPLGVCCDTKGSELGMVPLVFKEERKYKDEEGEYDCPVIIAICNGYRVWLLGIASPDVLKNYVDDNLVVMDNEDIPSKSGFFGVPKLIPLPTEWEKFKEVCDGFKKRS